MRIGILLLMVALTTVFSQPLAAQQKKIDPALMSKVQKMLKRNCAECHSGGQSDGDIDYITDLPMLIERKKIIPGDLTNKSRIWYRINNDDDPMPPDDAKTRPSDSDKQTLKEMILALGGKSLPAQQAHKKDLIRKRVSNADVVDSIHRFLSRVTPYDRPYQRFFVLNHLHNLPNKDQDKQNGVSSDFLNLVRAATSKTLNGLSWSPEIVNPRPIDDSKTILVFDVRDIEWDVNRSKGRPDLWNILVREYPYGLKHDQFPDNETTQRKSMEIYQWTTVDVPWVRAEWFVATANQPHNYHALLFDSIFPEIRKREPRETLHHDGKKRIEQPMNQSDLLKVLRVDIDGNLRRGRVARAAFTRSGVSSQPRMIERHRAIFGYLWNSYDFKKGNPQSNLLARPLGPVGVFEEKHGRQAFRHDGGELIFGLPNGLHGYLLIEANGDRISFGPPDIVEDRARTLGNGMIVNGLSCIACHKNGLITDFNDEVRYGIDGLPGEARRLARKLYPDRPELDIQIQKDQKRYQAAALESIRPFLSKKVIDQIEKSHLLVEPVGPVAKRFLVQTINLTQMAAELGMTPDHLKVAIENNPRLKRMGLAAVAGGGTINREIWESGEGLSNFQKAASILELGTPVSIQPQPWRGR